MKLHTHRGVTLVELLVVIAVLSFILAGIYGLLNSAYLTYNQSRAKLESQQTARMVMDYLVYRLREVDGGKATAYPYKCTDCHVANMDNSTSDDPKIPCVKDVSVPQKMPDILAYKKLTFPVLADIPAEFKNLSGYNYIQFKADLLPINGFNESFTDVNGNGTWDWTANDPAYDKNMNEKYDLGEPEVLEDMNSNRNFDYFGETWTFQLRTTMIGPYYQLAESLSFASLHKSDGNPANDTGSVLYNKSNYATGYSRVPVAYGLTGLGISLVPRVMPAAAPALPYAKPLKRNNRNVTIDTCYDATATKGCHGSSAKSKANTTTGPIYGQSLDIYGNATSVDLNRFIATHPFWNVQGLSVEVCTVDTKGKSQQLTRLRQFVNFRNLEINNNQKFDTN